MEFSTVADQVYTFYAEGRYSDAISVIDDARQALPEHDGRLTFWEACLYSVSGNSNRAVAILSEGTSRGLWWPKGMLADSDLDAARQTDGWDDVVAACQELEQARLAKRPAAHVRNGSGAGTVIALHGARADPESFADQWDAAIPIGWTLVAPLGDLPVPEGGWSWAHDAPSRASAVIRQIDGDSIDRPLILAGFSAGATLALELASSELRPDALALLAPYIADEGEFTEMLETLNIPVLLGYGSNDSSADAYAKLEGSVDEVLVFTELGHTLPEDLSAVFRATSALTTTP